MALLTLILPWTVTLVLAISLGIYLTGLLDWTAVGIIDLMDICSTCQLLGLHTGGIQL